MTDLVTETPDPDATPAVADPPVVETPAAEVVEAVVERPSDLPESFWDAEAKAPKWSDVATRLTRADELEAAETARREGVPEKVEAYVFDVAGDPILDAAGQPAVIDKDNPLAKAVAEVAHKHGVPQAVVSDLARAFVAGEVESEKALKAAMTAEVGKLGEKSGERVTAVKAFMTQHCGAHANEAIASLGTAAEIQAWEAVMTKLAGPPTSTVQTNAGRKFGEGWFDKSMNKAA